VADYPQERDRIRSLDDLMDVVRQKGSVRFSGRADVLPAAVVSSMPAAIVYAYLQGGMYINRKDGIEG